jgi:hypothetical protein
MAASERSDLVRILAAGSKFPYFRAEYPAFPTARIAACPDRADRPDLRIVAIQ